jgi:hypothetical protein
VRREAEKSACVEDEHLVWPTSTPLNAPFDPMPPSLQVMQNASISEHTSDTPSGVLLGGAGKKGRPPKVGGAKRDGTEEEDSASSRIETRLSTVFCIATAPLLQSHDSRRDKIAAASSLRDCCYNVGSV